MSGLKSISPSGSAEHVSGESEVTDGDKRYVKIICNILFATNFIQLAAGAYAFSLVTGQYQTHRGSLGSPFVAACSVKVPPKRSKPRNNCVHATGFPYLHLHPQLFD